MEIDAVITYVDGNDPVLNEKRSRYLKGGQGTQSDVAGSTRFADVGEIFWCVASLNKFAPWIRKIHIVTDGQDPGLENFMNEHFPSGHIPMEIVDHKVIFRGYEEYLPTFNSNSIETMTWRIPGLSEHFIEMNDDFMLCAPLSPQDLFTPDGKQTCYAKVVPILSSKILTFLKPKRKGRKPVTFKRLLLNAVKVSRTHPFWFLRINHTPRPLLVSCYEKFYAEHPDAIILNIKDRFRDLCQYVPKEVQFHLQYKRNKLNVLPYKDVLFYMEPKRKKDYVKRKLRKLEEKNYRFCCFNSIDQASAEDRALVEAWIWQRLGLEKP